MINKLLSSWLFLFSLGGFAQKVLFTEPKKLPNTVNTETEESFPVVSPDGNRIFFSRSDYEKNIGGAGAGSDIWMSTRDASDNWQEATNNLGVLNNEFVNAALGISKDGNTIYLFNTYHKTNTRKVSLCSSRYENGKWTDPQLLKLADINVGDNPYGLFMNEKEDVLMISMMGSGGIGEEDLFVSFKDAKGKWSRPKNLGGTVNTKDFEFSPFLDSSNRYLYFASTGHGGYGGADIFVTERLDDSWTNWSKPVNMGPKINSPGQELYFAITYSNEAFFTSTRFGDESNFYKSDIIILDSGFFENMVLANVQDPEKQKGRFVLASRIKNVSTGAPEPNILVLIVDEDGTVLDKKYTDENGLIIFEKLHSDHTYKIILDEPNPNLILTAEYDEDAYEVGETVSHEEFKLATPMEVPAHIASSDNSVKVRFTDKKTNSPLDIGMRVLFLNEIGKVLVVSKTEENGYVFLEKLSSEKQYNLLADDPSIQLEASFELVEDESSLMTYDLRRETSIGNRLAGIAANTFKGMDSYDLTCKLKEDKKPASFLDIILVDGNGMVVFRGKTDGNGFIIFKKLDRSKEYIVMLDQPNANVSISLNCSYDDKPLKPANQLTTRPAIGEEFAGKIFFGLNSFKADLPASKKNYDRIADMMRSYPTVKLEIRGHTDKIGRDDYNLELSKKRAEAVRTYLIDAIGMDPSDIEIIGFGSAKASSQKLKNQEDRKVEFIVKGY